MPKFVLFTRRNSKKRIMLNMDEISSIEEEIGQQVLGKDKTFEPVETWLDITMNNGQSFSVGNDTIETVTKAMEELV